MKKKKLAVRPDQQWLACYRSYKMEEKIYSNENDFFTESEEMEQDFEDEAIVRQIQREYSDYEGLQDGVDDLINNLIEEIFG